MHKNNPKTRYLEQFGDVLKQLINWKKIGDYTKASVLLSDSFQRFLGIEPTIFHSIQPSKVVDYLLSSFDYNTSELSILASLLKEQGELRFLAGEMNEALFNYQLAINIFEFIEHEERIYSVERMETRVWLQVQISRLASHSMS